MSVDRQFQSHALQSQHVRPAGHAEEGAHSPGSLNNEQVPSSHAARVTGSNAVEVNSRAPDQDIPTEENERASLPQIEILPLYRATRSARSLEQSGSTNARATDDRVTIVHDDSEDSPVRGQRSERILARDPADSLDRAVRRLKAGIRQEVEDEPTEEIGPPSKRRKINSAVRHEDVANDQSPSDSGDHTDQSSARSSRYAGTAAVGSNARSSRLPMQRRKSKISQRRAHGHADDHEESNSADGVHGQKTARGGKARARRRKPQTITPEEAANFELEPDLVPMSTLCVDSGMGKSSTRQARLQERDAAELEAKRAGTQARKDGGPPNSRSNSANEASHENGRPRNNESRVSARHVPTLQVVNGEIVLDESSRMIDRHADAEAIRPLQEEQLEDELTRKTNSNSHLKRISLIRWDAESTELFYNGLKMFGTDFEMISQLFPGRNRRHIKLKFVKEERADPKRLNEVLLGERTAVDMDSYSKISNTQYKDPSELEKDMAEDRKRLEEEQEREKEAMEELVRQRAEDAAAESAAVGESAKENESHVAEPGEESNERVKRGRKPGSKAGKKNKARSTPAKGSKKSIGGGTVLGPR